MTAEAPILHPQRPSVRDSGQQTPDGDNGGRWRLRARDRVSRGNGATHGDGLSVGDSPDTIGSRLVATQPPAAAESVARHSHHTPRGRKRPPIDLVRVVELTQTGVLVSWHPLRGGA